ncbi:hypothetical protein IFVP177_C140306 [Vibrio parahaemolyticus]
MLRSYLDTPNSKNEQVILGRDKTTLANVGCNALQTLISNIEYVSN